MAKPVEIGPRSFRTQKSVLVHCKGPCFTVRAQTRALRAPAYKAEEATTEF